MKICQLVAGSVLAAGLGAAGMMGAGTASAIGFAVDPGEGDGFSVGSGATADVSDGNRALAISVFGPASATTDGNPTGNTLIAIDGVSRVSGSSSDNNNVVTVLGETRVLGNSSGNNVLNLGGDVTAGGNANNTTTLAACGMSFTGQADHVTVSHGLC